MKKWWLLLLVLVCSMFTGCKKDTEDMVIEETDIPGVKVVDLTCAYEYSYSEQQDGNLLFAIKGEWKKNETWKIEYDQDAIAEGKELKQSHKEAQFEFTPKEGKSGYSEYFIELYDTDTQEKVYTFVVSIMLSQDETISVLSIIDYEPSKEEVSEEANEETTENVEETEETDFVDEEADEDMAAEFEEVVGNIKLSKNAEILEVAVQEYDEKKAGEMLISYEGQKYSCVIAPDTPLSYFEKQIEMDEYTKETEYIDDVEVIIYSIDNNRMILWKNKDNVCYALTEKNVSDKNSLKVVEMLIKNN